MPSLLKDFEGRCAYCLDPDDFRHPSQTHVDHFDCKLHGRKRHRSNLMLGCAACNMSKHDKPVVNPFDKQQRLLNCTEETEFPTDIYETDDGRIPRRRLVNTISRPNRVARELSPEQTRRAPRHVSALFGVAHPSHPIQEL